MSLRDHIVSEASMASPLSGAIATVLADQAEVAIVTEQVTVYCYLDREGHHRWGLVIPEGQRTATTHALADMAHRYTSNLVDEMLFGDDDE